MTTDRPLQLGMIGLGRMGANLSRRLMRDGHEVVVYDVNADAVTGARGRGGHRRHDPRGLRGGPPAPESRLDHGPGRRDHRAHGQADRQRS